MIECVIFDFDGTLVESNEIKRNVFYEVTEDILGAKSELEKLLSDPSAGDRYNIFDSLIRNLKPKLVRDVSSKYLSDLYTKICEDNIIQAQEISGTFQSLTELKKRKVKIFLSSATPTRALQRIIDMRGWTHLFDGIMGSPESKENHISSILISNHYSLSEIIYIGDSEVDQKAALSMGCKFIGIGKNSYRFDAKPSILLDNLEKLVSTLEIRRI